MTRTKEWLLERKNRLGASEVAAVLGMSRWATPADIQLSKLSNEIDEGMTESQQLGHLLQPITCRMATERLGLSVHFSEAFKADDNHPWLTATLDYLCHDAEGNPVNLECKATRDQSWDYIPEYYQIQLATQCHVHKIDRAVIAVLHASTKLETYEFRLSDCAWWPETLEKVVAWWNEHIVLGVPIEGDHTTPKHTIPAVSGKAISLDDKATQLISGYVELDSKAKEYTKQADALKTQIQAILGDAEIGLWNDQPLVTWKESRSERFDSTAFKKAMPAEYVKFTKTSVSRRFLVKDAQP